MAGFFDFANQWNRQQGGGTPQSISPEEAFAMYQQLQQQQKPAYGREGYNLLANQIGEGMGGYFSDMFARKAQEKADRSAGVAPVAPEDDPGLSAQATSPQSIAADILEIAHRSGPEAAQKHMQALMSMKVPAQERSVLIAGASLAQETMKKILPKEGAAKDPYGEVQWVADPQDENFQIGMIQKTGSNAYVPAVGPDGSPLRRESGRSVAKAGIAPEEFKGEGAKDKELTDFRNTGSGVQSMIGNIDELKTLLASGATPGIAGKTISTGVNIVNTAKQFFRVVGAGRNDSPEIMQAMAGAPVKELDATLTGLQESGLWKRLAASGLDAARVRSMYVAIAYSTAKSNNPDGRIATSDVDNALKELGGDLSDPAAATAILDDVKRRAVRNFYSKYDFSSPNIKGQPWTEPYLKAFESVLPYGQHIQGKPKKLSKEAEDAKKRILGLK